MANFLSDAKKQQVIALGQLGWTLRRIEAATGVRRETAGAYLKAAGLAVRPAGRWGHPPKAAKEVSTDSEPPASPPPTPPWPPRPQRAPAASACEPYRELIQLAVARGRQARAIWRDLVDDHGFPGRYASVRRFVRRLRGAQPAEAHPIIVTAPGEEGQVDYGAGPMVRHPSTRKYRRTRLFVFTLGYSRKSVRLLTFTSSTRRWAELHEESFRRLGGSVQVVVLDNLREGVLTADIYDPALNPLYRDVLAHYGVVALPCRVGDPDRKGKVESAIGHTQTALKGLRFETLEAAQAYLDRWDARWADTRIHGTTKRQVAAMFTEERPALRPLPLEPFRYYQFGRRTVHLDNCIEVDGGYYSAPPGWLSQEVAVQWNASHVRLLDPRTGQLLREHRRQAMRGRHVIHPDDRPVRTPPSTLTLLAQAPRAGTHIGPLCAAIHRREGEAGVRRILGVLSLVKKHGAPVVDTACAVALELALANYRFVRRYVERQPAPPLTLRQVDPLIRELTHYRDVIAQKTQEEIPR
jgi:transposase